MSFFAPGSTKKLDWKTLFEVKRWGVAVMSKWINNTPIAKIAFFPFNIMLERLIALSNNNLLRSDATHKSLILCNDNIQLYTLVILANIMDKTHIFGDDLKEDKLQLYNNCHIYSESEILKADAELQIIAGMFDDLDKNDYELFLDLINSHSAYSIEASKKELLNYGIQLLESYLLFEDSEFLFSYQAVKQKENALKYIKMRAQAAFCIAYSYIVVKKNTEELEKNYLHLIPQHLLIHDSVFEKLLKDMIMVLMHIQKKSPDLFETDHNIFNQPQETQALYQMYKKNLAALNEENTSELKIEL